MTIDLRSDTLTKPTPAMLEAMMNARVGDDVYGEDPNVNELQDLAASMFGMEAGLFCPSGTMTNQVAIKVHTQPGDELICADNAHVYKYEGGGIAFNSAVQAKLIRGDRGRITSEQVEEMVNGDDPHFPVSKLVCLENTSNRGGGSIYELDAIKDLRKVCDSRGMFIHLDGARVFNALVEREYTAKELGACFHSISICLSKGLGAPVGSVLLGSTDFIRQASRIRKVFGGGMRQAGFLAAAGIYALQHHVERLKTDHARASGVAEIIRHLPYIASVMPVETNIIIFQLQSSTHADRIQKYLRLQGVLCGRISTDELRFVFHLDISDEQQNKLVEIMQDFTPDHQS